MTLYLDIEQNLPQPLITALNLNHNVPVKRVGNFYDENTGPGCGTTCIWNGGGYYMDVFVCGQTYPSGLTFYCSSDCHRKIGESNKVFLSYRWVDSQIADKIASCLRGAEIEILRDINEIDFLETISEFMDTAGESRYFVAVITESYLYSRFCMYEFYQIAQSDQPVRTIPVMLGTVLDPGFEDQILDHWRKRHQEVLEAIRGIDKRYTEYLTPELDLLAGIPGQIENFFTLWRAKERPPGSRWLAANCHYLVGAIKTTFKPTEEDATNWTFSNKTVRGERAEDLPPIANWEPQPFYLHEYSATEARKVSAHPQVEKLLHGVYHDGRPMPESLPPGDHVVLIDTTALRSLAFCLRLLTLLERPDIRMVPIFLDETLRMPTSELELLRQWYERFVEAPTDKEGEQIDFMLSRFGPMMERLRSTLVPSLDIVIPE